MRALILGIAIAAIFWCSVGADSPESQALLNLYIATNPPAYRMSMSLAETMFGHNVAIWPVSQCQCYIADSPYSLESATWFQLDRTANRFIYMDALVGPLRSFGHLGQSDDDDSSFWRPMSMDCQTILDDPLFENWHILFVADTRNDRVRRLEFNWLNQSVVPSGEFSGCGIYRPIDLDINNGGDFSNPENDFLLILNSNSSITGMSTGGTCWFNFGVEGSGLFEFEDPSAIACGRWPFYTDPYDPYASTRAIYVADAGNSRLVKMHLAPDLQSAEWDTTWSGVTTLGWSGADIVGLDVDNNGHVWAALRTGGIAKFTWDLHYLTTFVGSPSFGGFNQPCDIFNTGGHLGCGNMYVLEDWTDTSGGQYLAIGTDIEGLQLSLFESGDDCIAAIVCNLIDFSAILIQIFDESSNLVKTVADGLYMSDWHIFFWDGTNEQGNPAPSNGYRVRITASSLYFSVASGEPTNTVVKEKWFNYECNPEFCTTALGGVGDCDGLLDLDIDDIVCTIAYIFTGGTTWCAPYSVDADGSCTVDIDDVVYLINFVFVGGHLPRAVRNGSHIMAHLRV